MVEPSLEAAAKQRTFDDRRRRLQRTRAIRGFAAAGAAHTELRRLAQDGAEVTDLEEASRLALTDARIYEVRERLFLDASTRMARLCSNAFAPSEG